MSFPVISDRNYAQANREQSYANVVMKGPSILVLLNVSQKRP